MIRLGVLGSTRGTHLLGLVAAINEGRLAARIDIVISNKKEALILSRASTNGLQTEFLNTEGLTRRDYDQKVTHLLEQHQVDLVVLIGYMRILSTEFVDCWANQVINVHPSLLPSFAGKMDAEVHQAVLDAKCKETGCTIHYVTQQVDAGPILLQKTCPVFEDDTVDTLKERVQKLEGLALIEVIARLEKTFNAPNSTQ